MTSRAVRFWTKTSGQARMPKRRAPWQGTRTGRGAGTQWRRIGAAPMRRGRFAGYYRKTGFYGRYNRRDGGGELKFHDVDLDSASVGTGGAIVASINLIGQNTTESTRIGRKCTLRSIGWRMQISLPEQDAVATPAPPDIIRVILYCDKQTNGAAAAVLDILETADFQSFNNLSNKSRFRVLMDKRWTLNYAGMASDNAAVVSQAAVTQTGVFFKKLNLPLEFSGTADPSTITEIRSNNLGVLLITQTGAMNFNSKIRLRFSDG